MSTTALPCSTNGCSTLHSLGSLIEVVLDHHCRQRNRFHGFADIERATGVPIYFANPYHSWERGTNENTNGLIRQYLPKRASMRNLTQVRCDAIARALNNRPRKRYRFRTPLERLDQLLTR